MENHAKASNGRYYVYDATGRVVKGPFFPANREERLKIFAEQTPGRGWHGAYYLRLPVYIRQLIKES
jgi:hypothetical protein